MSSTKTQTGKSKPVKNPAIGSNGVETEVLTEEETAAYLRVSVAEVLHLAGRGELPGRQIGGQWRFYKPALQHWLGTSKKKGLLSQIGALKNDPHLEEMLEEIYHRRDRPEIEAG